MCDLNFDKIFVINQFHGNLIMILLSLKCFAYDMMLI